MLIGGYLSWKYNGSLAMDEPNFIKQLLRGLVDINIGFLIYEFVNTKLNNIMLNRLGRILLNIIEIIGFISIFFIVNTKNSHMKYDFIMLLIFFVCISIAFSNKTYTGKLLSNKLVFYLEKLSVPIYLSHIVFINILNKIVETNNITVDFYILLSLAIIGSIIIAAIELKIIKLIPHIKSFTKKVFLVKDSRNG